MWLYSLLLCRVAGIFFFKHASPCHRCGLCSSGFLLLLHSFSWVTSTLQTFGPRCKQNRALTSDLEPYLTLWQQSCLLLTAQEPLHE